MKKNTPKPPRSQPRKIRHQEPLFLTGADPDRGIIYTALHQITSVEIPPPHQEKPPFATIRLSNCDKVHIHNEDQANQLINYLKERTL